MRRELCRAGDFVSDFEDLEQPPSAKGPDDFAGAEAPKTRFSGIPGFLNHRVSGFLSGLVILLLLGAGSWIINAALFPPEVTGWLRLQPDTSSWAGFFLGLGMWLGAGAACFGLLALISMASDLLQALAAMWRPIVIVAAAGYLLFFNDQGRELGHSLLGQHDRLPILSLFVALFYWAANTWHSARLGINHRLTNGVLGVASSNSRATFGDTAGKAGSQRR